MLFRRLRAQSSRALVLLVVGALTTMVPSAQTAGQTAERTVSLRVTIALVLPDLTVRQVPLHALELRSADDTAAAPVTLRAALDGTVAQSVKPGTYRLRSIQPAALGDSTYRWDVVITVPAAGASVELTNTNAAAAAAPKVVTRQLAPEREVFEHVRRGVFRVEAGLGHGSGFRIAEHGGLVVTNDHVIGTADAISVYLDSVTRVPAQIVARDHEADLALLRLPTDRCADCPALPLAVAADAGLVVAGERVIAIGFPLNQEMTLTSGIASSVRDGAIISDVNINHGNSGGPMLNLAGEVVGVTAFGDFTDQGGPGISGAIAITRLGPLLAKVPGSLAQLPQFEDRVLRTAPTQSYPLTILKQVADTASPKAYAPLANRNANKFLVSISTPVTAYVQRKAADAAVAGDRRKREAKAGVAQEQRYSEFEQSRDWEQYVGAPTTPVVAIAIQPKIGETFWSAFGRGLEAANKGYSTSQAQMKFQGDVRGARFYRNGVEVEAIRGGHGPLVMRIEDRWVRLKDVADMGYYVLPAEAFAPDSDGRPPVVTITIQDLKNPGKLSGTDIMDTDAARVWNDFVPYFRAVVPNAPISFADPGAKSNRVPLVCDGTSGNCTRR